MIKKERKGKGNGKKHGNSRKEKTKYRNAT